MTHPKGILVSIGGAEDRGIEDDEERRDHELDFTKHGILNAVVALAQEKAPAVEIITTASSIPEDYFAQYKKAFKKLGCSQIGHLNICKRDEATNKDLIKRITECDIVMFTGGDQLRLCSILGGTSMLERLKERYIDDKIIIAGTSAGAAAMSNTMICGGNPTRSYFKGEVMFSLGFGFLNNVIIDTHFDKRGRFGRLAQAIAEQPGAIGVGLGEDTGVIIEKGKTFRAIGSSSVVVLDGSKIHYNNISEIRDGMPISIGNMIVHLLSHSDVFEIDTREFTGVTFEEHKS
jgi:cyanophycinase